MEHRPKLGCAVLIHATALGHRAGQQTSDGRNLLYRASGIEETIEGLSSDLPRVLLSSVLNGTGCEKSSSAIQTIYACQGAC